MRGTGFFMFLMLVTATGAHAGPLAESVATVRDACAGLSDELADMKRMAGINTAVTGVGTVAGGVALGTGIAKARVDKRSDELEEAIAELEAMGAKRIETQEEFIEIFSGILMQSGDVNNMAMAVALRNKKTKLDAQSKKLGNIRTGTLAVSTATNIAGAVIAGTNRIKGDLQSQIDECIAGVDALKLQLGQARVSGNESDDDIARAQQIATECGMWTTVNLSSINKRATGAAVSSGVGAGVGLVGTVTSAMANSQSVRDGDDRREKNLNTTANVMAGGATVASAAATIFNATQIVAIKRAAEVADKCEGALR